MKRAVTDILFTVAKQNTSLIDKDNEVLLFFKKQLVTY